MVPSYELSKYIKVSIQYKLAQGYDIGTSKFQHFFSLKGNFSNINLTNMLSLEVWAQVYYITYFGFGEGFYAASAFIFTRPNFPISLSALINTALSTKIDGIDFLWNLTLTYSFERGVKSKHKD